MKTYGFNTLFLLLICSLIVLQNTGCKSAPKPISEKEAYTLLNELILDDTLIIREVYYQFEGLVLSDDMKKEFTREEVIFMDEQTRNPLVKELKPGKIIWFHKNYKPASDFVKPVYESDSGMMIHMSFPVISPDRKKMLIHWSLDCNCILGGSGGDDLYIKKNNRWKLVKQFNGWIS